MVQTSILLMGNASFHHSTERRRALLQHLNPQIKQLVEESDFKNAAPAIWRLLWGHCKTTTRGSSSPEKDPSPW